MEKSIEVHILGNDYPLRIEAANEAFVREIAAFVDARMRKVRSFVADPPSEQTTAVLAGLSIAEELFRLRRSTEATPAVLQALTDLTAQLDDVLGT